MLRMRAWVVIPLLAILGSVLGTVLGADAHCMEHQNRDRAVSIAGPSTGSHESKPQTPLHHESVCDHLHCCGMILITQIVSRVTLPITKHPQFGSFRLPRVTLDLPLKPPTV